MRKQEPLERIYALATQLEEALHVLVKVTELDAQQRILQTEVNRLGKERDREDEAGSDWEEIMLLQLGESLGVGSRSLVTIVCLI
jgi:uncharacterized small protein (DUF1192 family)